MPIANINAQNPEGDTALHLAIRYVRKQYVDSLLSLTKPDGSLVADLSLANKKGETAEDVANGNKELEETLRIAKLPPAHRKCAPVYQTVTAGLRL